MGGAPKNGVLMGLHGIGVLYSTLGMVSSGKNCPLVLFAGHRAGSWSFFPVEDE